MATGNREEHTAHNNKHQTFHFYFVKTKNIFVSINWVNLKIQWLFVLLLLVLKKVIKVNNYR